MSKVTSNLYVVAFVGGGASSVVAQTLMVPVDVISQHMMLVGQRGNIEKAQAHALKMAQSGERIRVPHSIRAASSLQIAKYIGGEIYKRERVRGFYRGFFLSTMLVSLNSALWWPFYYFYQGISIKLYNLTLQIHNTKNIERQSV